VLFLLHPHFSLFFPRKLSQPLQQDWPSCQGQDLNQNPGLFCLVRVIKRNLPGPKLTLAYSPRTHEVTSSRRSLGLKVMAYLTYRWTQANLQGQRLLLAWVYFPPDSFLMYYLAFTGTEKTDQEKPRTHKPVCVAALCDDWMAFQRGG
jgi:hypothetical protein